MKAHDLTGKLFGRLRAVNRASSNGKRTTWNCVCECGREKAVATASLVHGETTSCGCLAIEILSKRNSTRVKHGWSSHKLYGVWRAMMDRCYNPENQKFADYGGRGISVCKSWHDVSEFCIANIEGWRDGLTMDRKDNNGPYSPENVRWVTQTVQMRNNRRNRHVILNGRRVTLAEMEEITGWKIYPVRADHFNLNINMENNK